MLHHKKIFKYDQLKLMDSHFKTSNKEYLITNGCFDIIHCAHIYVLKECYNICQNVILFINTDESIRELKGSNKPFIPLEERMYIMSSIEFVTMVFPLPSTRLYDVFNICTPTYWAKGGDYTLDSLDQEERHIAEEKGIQIKLIPPLKGKSTSNIISDIRRKTIC